MKIIDKITDKLRECSDPSVHMVRFGHPFEAMDDDEWCATCKRDCVEARKDDDAEPCRMNQLFYRGAEAFCAEDGKTWTEHCCTRCQSGNRIQGWSFCLDCHDNNVKAGYERP